MHAGAVPLLGVMLLGPVARFINVGVPLLGTSLWVPSPRRASSEIPSPSRSWRWRIALLPSWRCLRGVPVPLDLASVFGGKFWFPCTYLFILICFVGVFDCFPIIFYWSDRGGIIYKARQKHVLRTIRQNLLKRTKGNPSCPIFPWPSTFIPARATSSYCIGSSRELKVDGAFHLNKLLN
jgi:hypothetical protein